jgi:hypothetical protein
MVYVYRNNTNITRRIKKTNNWDNKASLISELLQLQYYKITYYFSINFCMSISQYNYFIARNLIYNIAFMLT